MDENTMPQSGDGMQTPPVMPPMGDEQAAPAETPAPEMAPEGEAPAAA